MYDRRRIKTDGKGEEKKANKYLGYIKNKKQIPIILIGIVLGLLLIFIGSTSGREKKANISDVGATSAQKMMIEYTEYTESRIKEMCGGIEGISNVKVVVTLDCGFEEVYAENEEYVTLGSGSGERALLIKEKSPQLRGVGIVCSASNKSYAQNEITELIASAYDIPRNHIYVSFGK